MSNQYIRKDVDPMKPTLDMATPRPIHYVIICPQCNEEWDIVVQNVCQCGAVRKTYAQSIEKEGKSPDPWFILKYVKTVLERGFPVGDIIELIRKKLHEYSCAASIPLKTTSIEEDGSEAYEEWLNDPKAQLK